MKISITFSVVLIFLITLFLFFKFMKIKTGKYIKFDDLQIYAETFGNSKNPAVLLISGAMAPARFWTDEFCKQISDNGYFVVRYDHRDMGLSSSIDYTRYSYTLRDLEKDAIKVLDAYNIRKAHFIGHSMGGMLVQLIALDYPQRCLSITSISDGLLSEVSLSKDEEGILKKSWEILLENKPTMDYQKSLLGFIKSYRYLNGTVQFDEGLAKKFIYDMYKRSNHIYLTEDGQVKSFQVPHNHVRAQENIKLRKEDLQKIDIPTLIIHGQEDYVMLPTNAKETSKLIVNSKLKIIPGMGHMFFNRGLETEIAKLIVNFIKTNND